MPDQNLSCHINVVDLKEVLGEIEANRSDLHWSGFLPGAEAITLSRGHIAGEQAPSTHQLWN